jgi:hypothetical protein
MTRMSIISFVIFMATGITGPVNYLYTAAALTYATEVRSRERRGAASGLFNSAGGLGDIQTQLLGFQAMIATNAALIFGGAVYLAAMARQVLPAGSVKDG